MVTSAALGWGVRSLNRYFTLVPNALPETNMFTSEDGWLEKMPEKKQQLYTIIYITGWWQLKYVSCSPRTLGKMNPF